MTTFISYIPAFKTIGTGRIVSDLIDQHAKIARSEIKRRRRPGSRTWQKFIGTNRTIIEIIFLELK